MSKSSHANNSNSTSNKTDSITMPVTASTNTTTESNHLSRKTGMSSSPNTPGHGTNYTSLATGGTRGSSANNNNNNNNNNNAIIATFWNDHARPANSPSENASGGGDSSASNNSRIDSSSSIRRRRDLPNRSNPNPTSSSPLSESARAADAVMGMIARAESFVSAATGGGPTSSSSFCVGTSRVGSPYNNAVMENIPEEEGVDGDDDDNGTRRVRMDGRGNFCMSGNNCFEFEDFGFNAFHDYDRNVPLKSDANAAAGTTANALNSSSSRQAGEVNGASQPPPPPPLPSSSSPSSSSEQQPKGYEIRLKSTSSQAKAQKELQKEKKLQQQQQQQQQQQSQLQQYQQSQQPTSQPQPVIMSSTSRVSPMAHLGAAFGRTHPNNKKTSRSKNQHQQAMLAVGNTQQQQISHNNNNNNNNDYHGQISQSSRALPDGLPFHELSIPNEIERSVSELTMRSHGAFEKHRYASDSRRMAYYAVGRTNNQNDDGNNKSSGGGNRRCYFTGDVIPCGMPFYAGSVQQGPRTLVVFCLPSALDLPRGGIGNNVLVDNNNGGGGTTIDDRRERYLALLPDPDAAILEEMSRRYPAPFDTLPVQVRSPHCWRLFVKFCFFSGLPIAEGEMHYRVRSSVVGFSHLASARGEEIALSHEVMEAVNGEVSAEILRLPNQNLFDYLKRQYSQQSSKLREEVFVRSSWEMVRPEV